ncbi:forespore capture DNA-binding protein RefZ [Salsuginibacillus kocurii]|uniref:forespore capture DNA-binding protein RefZ n=1 Tax=Salsuginibacillus kocurii TaxID=427078 RepID=UPI0003625C36|nr:forespore capture DNA-binding protein RefZ [Salsuginibacillus kocurii]
MRRNGEETKRRIRTTAASLFMVRGFHGTSIRMIAAEADVNIAHVSYHFGGKQGLLENIVTDFLEGYLAVLESNPIEEEEELRLIHVVHSLLNYQQDHHQEARFVLREMTIDSTLMREVMTTYLQKERYILHELLDESSGQRVNNKEPDEWDVLQLRSMLTMPFLHPEYIREVFHLEPRSQLFLKQYTAYIRRYLEESGLLQKRSSYKV